ncbi:hypothetical protein EYF80_052132 [Liparis tanakae]|uniref:Uncharacterized protein n=1 Tax=Liparis tanakae TaxID=230148 RepID=A0A4Z2F9X2_9TELE|nr:hypothetical protein EYF80_052132 [Liparis tanakae]
MALSMILSTIWALRLASSSLAAMIQMWRSLRGSDVDAHRLRQVADGLSHHGLGRVAGLQPGRLQPHVLALVAKEREDGVNSRQRDLGQPRASGASSDRSRFQRVHESASNEHLEEPMGFTVPGHLQLPGDLLQPGGGDPGRRVMRIGLPHGLQQQASLLDVTAMCEKQEMNRQTSYQHKCTYGESPSGRQNDGAGGQVIGYLAEPHVHQRVPGLADFPHVQLPRPGGHAAWVRRAQTSQLVERGFLCRLLRASPTSGMLSHSSSDTSDNFLCGETGKRGNNKGQSRIASASSSSFSYGPLENKLPA